MNGNDEAFSLAPGMCSPWIFIQITYEKQSDGKSWNRGFCALSKLVYFKTEVLELVESSMEVPTSPKDFYLLLAYFC